MTSLTTITPLSTYRNESPYPFCPGCGHGSILDHLNAALLELELDPRQVVLVSDIGCAGLSDQYFSTNAFHGLHGRSVTYACGIKLARQDLHVVVLMGDGGTGIGGTHLLNAARRNIGVTVLVFNNMNFGMTGGQHSSTTPFGAATSTTPDGNLEAPLDICAHRRGQWRRLRLSRHELRQGHAKPHCRGDESTGIRSARHLGDVHRLLRAEESLHPQGPEQ